MKATGWAITMGLGAAVGAVAIMMMPRSNPTRKIAEKAADKVECTSNRLSGKLSDKLDMM